MSFRFSTSQSLPLAQRVSRERGAKPWGRTCEWSAPETARPRSSLLCSPCPPGRGDEADGGLPSSPGRSGPSPDPGSCESGGKRRKRVGRGPGKGVLGSHLLPGEGKVGFHGGAFAKWLPTRVSMSGGNLSTQPDGRKDAHHPHLQGKPAMTSR